MNSMFVSIALTRNLGAVEHGEPFWLPGAVTLVAGRVETDHLA